MKRKLRGVVRSLRQFEALTSREKGAYARVLEAISGARLRDLPLSRAAREAGTTVRTILRYAAPAVERLPSGRYRVRARDRLYRRVRVISEAGPVWEDTWDSLDARRASGHAHAVDEYGRLGDARVFDPFRGQRVGNATLATDIALLAGFAAAGELDAFDLYEEKSS